MPSRCALIRLALVFIVAGWATIGFVRQAAAHHVPGHGASEGVRNLNSLGGGTGQAISRVALLSEISRNSTSLNPGNTYNTSLLGEYSPHPWVSLGAQLPLLVVDEDAAGVDPKVGYGDTRAFFRLTPNADKLIHRVVTTGFNVSFPTRTITFEADPGKIWSFSPTVIFTRTYMKPFWQVLGLANIENRPAGTSIDLSVGAQAGYRAWGKLTPAIGMLADVRVATFCTQPGGGSQQFCKDGRATETEREVGTTRVTSFFSLTYAYAKWGLVSAQFQLPASPKRDFDIAGSLNVQFMF